nr:immunoglobulin heavy chain junction region [Macaca mulatta]MOX59240.1 immunoglobulin heavy chain junction region [Macaca mulatta]MOX60362.1 immunoglobulin heavy chain junction region [Macaca mulatta]MOX60776.1 immunoglobulin heavy chain junction region [Macaca mulatta]MOX62301.1 immunoglobulin heavy chain junction region [Macaca mulatta]
CASNLRGNTYTYWRSFDSW